MGTVFFLLGAGGTIYSGFNKCVYDTDSFSLFQRVLVGISKDSTHQAIKAGLPVRWRERCDTVYPFGDKRQCHYETVWTFNLDNDNDMLLFSKADRSGRLPLDMLRQRAVTLEDFEACHPPTPPTFDPGKAFPQPYWEPELSTHLRNTTFVRRLLDDFNYQWRHILRHRYNDFTFRQLACAIMRLATLDFTTVEVTTNRQGSMDWLVWVQDLPAWEPLKTCLVAASRGWVVVSQDPAAGIPLIREHMASHGQAGYYLILSVRHVVLCRADGDALEWTRPEPLLDGSTSPTDRALALLLWLTSPIPPRHVIQRLPLELQDRIIRYVSQGSVEAARVGCVLGVGSPFAWMDGRMMVLRRQRHHTWLTMSPVESEIRFGEHLTGLAYRGSERTIKPPYTATEFAPGAFIYS